MLLGATGRGTPAGPGHRRVCVLNASVWSSRAGGAIGWLAGTVRHGAGGLVRCHVPQWVRAGLGSRYMNRPVMSNNIYTLYLAATALSVGRKRTVSCTEGHGSWGSCMRGLVPLGSARLASLHTTWHVTRTHPRLGTGTGTCMHGMTDLHAAYDVCFSTTAGCPVLLVLQ